MHNSKHNNKCNNPLLWLIGFAAITLLFSLPVGAESHDKDIIAVTCTDLDDPINTCTMQPENASLKEIMRTIDEINQCKVAENETSAICSTPTGDISCQKSGNQASCSFPGQIEVECPDISNNSANCSIKKPTTQTVADNITPLAKTGPEREIARVISEICLNESLSTELKRDCRAMLDAGFSGEQDELQKMLEQITPNGAIVAFDTAKISGQSQVRSLNHFLSLRHSQNHQSNKKNFRIFRYQPNLRQKVMFGSYQLMDQTETGDPLLGDSFSKLGIFINGSFGKSEKDTEENELGFSGDNINMTTGFDYRLSNKLNLGTAFGLSQSENTLASDRGQLDFSSYTLLFFGAFYPTPTTFVNLVASYAGNEYDQERHLRFTQNNTTVNQNAQADYFGHQYLLELSLGISKVLTGINFETSAHLQFSRSNIDEFQEQMSSPDAAGSGWALKLNENKSKSAILKLGTQASYAWSKQWGVLLPQFGLFWNKELETSKSEITGSFAGDPNNTRFTLPSNEADSSYFDLNTAVTALLPHGRMVFLSYQTFLAFDDYKSSTLSIGMRMEL